MVIHARPTIVPMQVAAARTSTRGRPGCAGGGGITMWGACAATEKAAAPPPAAGGSAAAQDAEKVIWETPQSKRPNISVDVHAHWSPPSFANAQKEVGGGRGSTRSL